MSSFKDDTGHKWKLRITVGTIKKVHADTDVNLGQFLDDEMALAKKVMGDPLLSAAVLFSILEEQIDDARLSEADFAERLYGDTFRDAKDALWDAFLDFCPSQQREALQNLEAKSKKVQEKLLKKLNETDVEADLESQLISFGSPTNQPASAESARTHIPPAS